jgi:hypothetical protein
VGVNAPGTEKSTTVFPPNNSAVVSFFGPSPVILMNDPSGSFSLTVMVMVLS